MCHSNHVGIRMPSFRVHCSDSAQSMLQCANANASPNLDQRLLVDRGDSRRKFVLPQPPARTTWRQRQHVSAKQQHGRRVRFGNGRGHQPAYDGWYYQHCRLRDGRLDKLPGNRRRGVNRWIRRNRGCAPRWWSSGIRWIDRYFSRWRNVCGDGWRIRNRGSIGERRGTCHRRRGVNRWSGQRRLGDCERWVHWRYE